MIHSVIAVLLEPLRRFAWNQLTLGEYSGIAIVDVSRAKGSRQTFHTRTLEALELMRRVDPRRFRRVCSFCKHIVNQELPFLYGSYDSRLRACYIDFMRLDFTKHPELMLWGYAAILVHEATHGAIHSFGIRSSPENRERIERLCDSEASRFLRRNSRKAGDLWEETMNRPGRRERQWRSTRWQRWIALWKRRRATSRMGNSRGKAEGFDRRNSGY